MSLPQLLWRIRRIIFTPKFVSVKKLSENTPSKPWRILGRRPISMLSQNIVILLNERRSIVGSDVWFKSDIPLLWRYHLHYFDDLNAVDAHHRKQWHRHLIDRWIDENPPVSKPAWDAYPTSLRIVNWIQWTLSGNALKTDWKDSLASQAEWLSFNLERDLLGNHLIANAKALIFAGIFFSGEKAGVWRKRGETVLETQIPIQILSDGGHYERSPMYHAIVLEDMLELIHLYQIFELPLPSLFTNRVIPMLHWLSTMSHPDGGISFFNDATHGQAHDLKYLSYLAKSLDFQLSQQETTGCLLAASGYARIKSNDAVLLTDVGSVGPDVQPAHAHAGTLSFELSIKGQRMIVNSGISEYGLSEMRNWQRSTAAHSSLALDHADSSVVWSGFRVAQRATVSDAGLNEKTGKIWGEHEGYRRLLGLGIHRREWHMTDNSLEISDFIQGTRHSDIRLTFHLHPLIKEISIFDKHHIRLIHPSAGIVRLQLPDSLMVKIEKGDYFPGFGINEPNFRVLATGNQSLPARLITQIKW